MIFKDHSVPSVESGLEGGGYRLEAWRIVWRWCRNPGDNEKGLNKGSDNRVQEKRMDSQTKIQEVEFTVLVG